MAKKSPNQETDLENMGLLQELNDTMLILNDKGITHALLQSLWYHSEPSEVPYFLNQFLDWDFFCHFLQQGGSKKMATG